jgi:LysM repeat protein
MPISHKSPYRRHAFGAIAVCLAGVAALAARQQGWLGTVGDAQRNSSDNATIAAADVPPPNDELLEPPLDSDSAQTEPAMLEPEPEPALAPAPRNRRVRPSQWETSRLALDDGFEDSESTGRKKHAKSKVVTAGFEEVAPLVPDTPDDEQPSGRQTSKADKETVARRSGDSAKSAAPSAPLKTDLAQTPALLNGKKIQTLIDEDNYIDAQKELSRWYWQKPDEREEILPQLHKLSRALYFSPQPHFYEPYVVKAGDQLRVVGQQYKLSWEYIAKLNRVDARKIRAGQKLKVVPGPFGAIVFLERFELVVHLNGSFVKSYGVGVGKDGTTPLGTFAVKNKIADPTYYGPEGGSIAHDNPKNPLGERWIDIGDGYGIHGTIEPESIGKKESRGCIRMLNSDVEEVYDFLVIGSEVKIVHK